MPDDVRLPANVRPTRYDLTLTPDLEAFTFEGSIAISVELAEAIDVITLHALELTIHEASVTQADGAVRKATVSFNEDAETATLMLDKVAFAGDATINIRFAGILNDQLRGFYRSTYTGPDGKPQTMATTQFEATDARRCLPCWDEPAVKAIFVVTMVAPEHLTVVSNMPIESTTPAGAGKKAVRFQETPKMSTYLLAFVVGDLDHVTAKASNGTTVGVYTTKGKGEQGRFALENGVKILEYMNDYFGIPYPLPKVDHIAIPDFAAGAMENWGCITYRETALLFDPANSAAGTRQRILEVVAHEMAHMWFGDLVTMAWWDDLWLNESFATWMGDKTVDHIYPDWNMWTQFVSHGTNSGLALDGLRNSHPIEVAVSDPAQIRELFDAISYQKGGAVLRMLEGWLGHDTFRDGLRSYLRAHSYANARGRDLWTALGGASGEAVPAVMASWITQTGYPVLHAEANGDTLSLRQERFLYDHVTNPQPDSTQWKIPVRAARQGSSAAAETVMEAITTSVALPGAGWVKVNAGQTGFYRVNYTGDAWARLTEAVRRQELTPVDRLGLQSDAWALVRAGYLPATQYLGLAEAYAGETDATVWGEVSSCLASLENLILAEDLLPKLDGFGQKLFSGILAKVGWDAKPGEGHLDSLLRSTVLGMSTGYGVPEAIAEAKRRFEAYVKDPASLHPDLRGVVVGTVGQEGDEDTYDRLWDHYKRAELAEEKLRFLRSLTRFKQPELLQRTLETALGPDVRLQDSVMVIGGVAGNRIGRPLAWKFVQDNWDEIDRRYGSGGFGIMSLVGMTGGFTTLDRAAEVEGFFAEHPAPSAARTVQQSLERIRLSAAWLDKNRAPLAEWFAGR
ncbi:MAG: M1 family peptidase [Dehalococcoidia bacterium]|nr:M1 family peptidase [Dehalococcoidia bacterium]